MSDDGWNPISDDGERMIAKAYFGYAIYSVNDTIDPRSDSRTFVHRGVVGDFELAQQWLKDGKVQGPAVTIYVEPKQTKAKSGQSA